MYEEDPLRRKVLLYLSADLVGSTAYKNNPNGAREWLRTFIDFYRDFDVYFVQQLDRQDNLSKFSRSTKPKRPELWKSLGDEILFIVEIKNHYEAQYYVHCFRSAVSEYSSDIARNSPLRLKGTAWIAGFPVGNAQIFEKNNPQSSENSPAGRKISDFIGPHIDIGFRISKYSNNFKFVISIELTLLLIQNPSDAFSFFIEPPQVLKGVLNHKPYPLIWLKCADAKLDIENKLLNIHQQSCKIDELKTYCENYLKDTGKPFMVPYLIEDGAFQTLPDWYEAEFNGIEDLFKSTEDYFT